MSVLQISLLLFSLVALAAAGGWLHYRRIQLRRRMERRAVRREKKHAEIDRARRARRAELARITTARAKGDRRAVVLVVDDSDTVLEAAKSALADRGYRVVLASNGREAWSTMQDTRPDIMVSDIDMPALDGFGLLRLVRSDLQLANLPVILMTGDANRLLEAGKLADISGILSKPFADRDLVDQVRFLLQEP